GAVGGHVGAVHVGGALVVAEVGEDHFGAAVQHRAQLAHLVQAQVLGQVALGRIVGVADVDIGAPPQLGQPVAPGGVTGVREDASFDLDAKAQGQRQAVGGVVHAGGADAQTVHLSLLPRFDLDVAPLVPGVAIEQVGKGQLVDALDGVGDA